MGLMYLESLRDYKLAAFWYSKIGALSPNEVDIALNLAISYQRSVFPFSFSKDCLLKYRHRLHQFDDMTKALRFYTELRL